MTVDLYCLSPFYNQKNHQAPSDAVFVNIVVVFSYFSDSKNVFNPRVQSRLPRCACWPSDLNRKKTTFSIQITRDMGIVRFSQCFCPSSRIGLSATCPFGVQFPCASCPTLWMLCLCYFVYIFSLF